jgi:hypothetical protein
VFFDDGAADRQSHAHAVGFCREGSNSCSRLSALKPGPVSRTATRTCSLALSVLIRSSRMLSVWPLIA